METLKKVFMAGFLFLGITEGAYAAVGDIYITSKGYIFHSVKDSGFGEAWQAPDGSIWSADMGMYAEHVGLCEKMGGRLPSRDDFLNLLQFFESQPGYGGCGEPTDVGFHDLDVIFYEPDGHRQYYLSSTRGPYSDVPNYIFFNKCNGVWFGDGTSPFRCVK